MRRHVADDARDDERADDGGDEDALRAAGGRRRGRERSRRRKLDGDAMLPEPTRFPGALMLPEPLKARRQIERGAAAGIGHAARRRTRGREGPELAGAVLWSA